MLVVALGIIGTAAGTAMQVMAKAPAQTDAYFQIETQLISKMEQIRSLPFASVTVGTGLSDSITVNGTTYQRSVTVILTDGNADGIADTSFKQVTVTCGNQTISTLIAQ